MNERGTYGSNSYRLSKRDAVLGIDAKRIGLTGFNVATTILLSLSGAFLGRRASPKDPNEGGAIGAAVGGAVGIFIAMGVKRAVALDATKT